MGLDVSVYERVEHIGAFNEREHDDCDEVVHLYYAGFEQRGDGLVEGAYRVSGETEAFRAGSYSGYNRWREQLCDMVCGRKPEAVWSGEVAPLAFGELINFADNEGFIGPKTSAKLANDFETLAGQAEDYARRLGEIEGRWFLDRYRDFRNAFRLAANHGAVKFH